LVCDARNFSASSCGHFRHVATNTAAKLGEAPWGCATEKQIISEA
jgi:hypothetical protein